MAQFLELTVDNLAGYLRSKGWIADGPARVTPMGWGVSNAVYRVQTADDLFVVKQARARLRTREPWFSMLDRIHRETFVMKMLGSLLPESIVPVVLHSDSQNYVVAMEHAPTEAKVWKEMLLAGLIDLPLGEQVGRALSRIHNETAKLHTSFNRLFGDHTVFVQLRVDPFYRRVQERLPAVASLIQPLIDQLLSVKEALCHGDYSPKNILVHAQGFMLVDYETAHFGDPTFDIGFFLSHLLLKAIKHNPADAGMLDLTKAFWSGYAADNAETVTRGIQHLGACILSRTDGTSPVDYLEEGPKKEAARGFGKRVLLDRPQDWEQVLALYATCVA